MSYDRRSSRQAAVPNLYADDLDAGYIAMEVVLHGKSKNWALPNNEVRAKIAAAIEKRLAPHNIGLIDEGSGTWGFKSGGSRYFR
jgi:hypothetical protein